jgi:NosL
MISRRDFALFLAGFVVACGKDGERCATCGMKIDPNSAFRAEVVIDGKTNGFDTAQCALTAYRAHGGTLRVQEFYSRGWVQGSTVRFVKGSDVLGPMGPDLIAVDPARVEKFQHDHGGTHVYALAEIDDGALAP